MTFDPDHNLLHRFLFLVVVFGTTTLLVVSMGMVLSSAIVDGTTP